ncbi:WD40 repeat domain-containing protein [Bradyrhizobium sp. BRP22]|uniref:WD40 repeat domain-containing protein n=1 Tax=Bradyrhizobium sp. BRP22 TaxID=2793821 RepID=UPI001CD21BB7|nr:WD40 repeat domain-containing protein [Bradyrhizobium sp. BRP22]MCA1452692.1 WD40 repeat domain-containing protein [Bradyrhizobium sp. BRP22]
MDTVEVDAASLYNLLGRHWRLDVPVDEVAFDRAGKTVAFSLADGSLALASVAEAEPPQQRYRVGLEDGRPTISARRQPIPPVMKVAIGDPPLRIFSPEPSGIIVHERGGRLFRVAASGTAQEILEIDDQALEALAFMVNGSVLAAVGGSIVSYDPGGGRFATPTYAGMASALAVSADGASIAIASTRGLFAGKIGSEPDIVFEVGKLAAISWSPDGVWIAASLERGGIVLLRPADERMIRIPDYPATARSLAWSADSRRLVTSGAFRIIVWDVSTLDDGRAEPASVGTGQAGFIAVATIDLQSRGSLIAAGYGDGKVVVAKIGSRDELLVKAPGQGEVRAIRWSTDGQHLAFGTAEGEAAIVTFPPQLFK